MADAHARPVADGVIALAVGCWRGRVVARGGMDAEHLVVAGPVVVLGRRCRLDRVQLAAMDGHGRDAGRQRGGPMWGSVVSWIPGGHFFGGGMARPQVNKQFIPSCRGGGIKNVVATGVPTNPQACIWRGPRGCATGRHSPRGQGLVGTFCGCPLWNKHVFVWHGPLGLRRKSVNMGHVQEAWRWFEKGRAKLVRASSYVGAPGCGSKRTRRVYQRRRKHLVNAKDIFMGKYREFVQDTCVVIAAVRDMHAWRRSLMSTMAMMMATMTGDSSGDDDNGVRD